MQYNKCSPASTLHFQKLVPVNLFSDFVSKFYNKISKTTTQVAVNWRVSEAYES